MDSDVLLLVSALGGLVVILLSFIYFQRKLSKGEAEPAEPAEARSESTESKQDGAQPTRRNLRNRRRGMRGRARRNLDPAVDQEEREGSAGGVVEEEGPDEPEESEFVGMSQKQIKKAMKKREKREQREALEASRQAAEENREKKNQKYEEARAMKEMERQEKERAAQERALEEQKKSQEEYDKWKDMFAVEDKGSTVNADVDSEVDLLNMFIQHVKGKKVVMIEELAGEFNLRIHEAMNRLEALEMMGRITGVFDDRGKFIYISRQELRAVANFINKKGRVSISELAKESNKLIDLNVAEAKLEENSSS